jgi:hypothetical protein
MKELVIFLNPNDVVLDDCNVGQKLCHVISLAQFMSNADTALISTKLCDKKSAGVSDPFLYLILKLKSIIASLRLFTVLVCSVPRVTKGLGSMYRMNLLPLFLDIFHSPNDGIHFQQKWEIVFLMLD